MRVLVVGCGMYVLGREGHGNGTVFSALAEASRDGLVADVCLAARDPARADEVLQAAAEINDRLGCCVPVRYAAIATGAAPLAGVLDQAAFDCAIVVTPDDTHYAIARALIEAGCHVLVVKPLTPGLSEARQLTELAARHGVYGAVEFHKRYDESNLIARRLVRDGEIGDPVTVEIEFSQRIDIPTRVFREWAARTNVFQYLGCHYADLIRFITGYEPEAVTAMASGTSLRQQGIATPDTVQALVRWRHPREGRRFGALLNIGWVDPSSSPAMSHQRMRVIGTRGRIECDQTQRGIVVVREGSGTTHPNPYFSESWERLDGAGRRFDGYGYRSIRTFLEDVRQIRGGEQTPEQLEGRRPTFRDALPSTAVIEAVTQCLASDVPTWRLIA